MFNREDKMEIERLKTEIENYQSQLKVKTMEHEQLQKQYEHKHNELIDTISYSYNRFKEIVKLAERNDYGKPEQKIRQIKEFAEEQRNYYAQLTVDTPLRLKNRTTTTDQSNK